MVENEKKEVAKKKVYYKVPVALWAEVNTLLAGFKNGDKLSVMDEHGRPMCQIPVYTIFDRFKNCERVSDAENTNENI
jgi:hypothetical protein